MSTEGNSTQRDHGYFRDVSSWSPASSVKVQGKIAESILPGSPESSSGNAIPDGAESKDEGGPAARDFSEHFPAMEVGAMVYAAVDAVGAPASSSYSRGAAS